MSDMTLDITRDDSPDYWTCRSSAGIAAILELETVEKVGIPWPDPDLPPAFGELRAGYRVHGRAVSAAYTTGGEENWGTLGIAKDLDKRFRAHRAQAVVRRAHDAQRIAQGHFWHHCGDRCPFTGETPQWIDLG